MALLPNRSIINMLCKLQNIIKIFSYLIKDRRFMIENHKLLRIYCKGVE